MIADRESSRIAPEQRQPESCVEVDVGGHQHAAKPAVVGRAHTDRDARYGRALHVDAHREPAVEIVLAADPILAVQEVEACAVLGHAPDALAAFYRDFRAHRQVVDILPGTKGLHEYPGQQTRRWPLAMGAGDGDAELDVLADSCDTVIDDR